MSFLVDSFGVRLGGARRRPLPLSPPAESIPAVFWMADHEVANLADVDWNDALTGSQPSEVDFFLDDTRAHTGAQSMYTEVTTDGVSQLAVRLQLWEQVALGDAEVWWSAWCFIPANTTLNSGAWSIGDIKQALNTGISDTSEPVYSFNFVNVNSSSFRIAIRTKVGSSGQDISSTQIHAGSVNAPLGEWFHFEVHYKPAFNGEGIIETFINGVQDFSDLARTTKYNLEAGNPMGWTHHSRADANAIYFYKLNNYATGSGVSVSPNPAQVWFDDAVLAEGRLWPVWQNSLFGRFRPSASADDAVQVGTTVTLTNTTIAMSSANIVGLRFPSVRIPQGRTIKAAWLSCTRQATNSTAFTATISGEASANAAQFTTAASNISGRTKTSASVPWTVPPWSAPLYTGATRNYRTADHRSPDLKSIIQEIVNNPSWVQNNALALIIEGSGAGTRTFAAHDHSSLMPPDLYIVWASA